MRSTLLATVTAFALLSPAALAWNGHGHMVVADIAWRQLTPATRNRVHELLKLNPDYEAWTAGVSPSKKAEVAFMRASKWADDIKGKPDYTSGDADEAGATSTTTSARTRRSKARPRPWRDGRLSL